MYKWASNQVDHFSKEVRLRPNTHAQYLRHVRRVGLAAWGGIGRVDHDHDVQSDWPEQSNGDGISGKVQKQRVRDGHVRGDGRTLHAV